MVQRMFPPTPLGRKLARQSLLFATAQGAFLTGSAVFFTEVVGLSAAQVGLGLTIAGIVSFLVAYPAGKIVDRIGPRKMWMVGTLGGAIGFAFWPWMHGFAAYLIVSVTFEIFHNAGGAGYNAYMLDVLPPTERVDTQAYLYSAMNVGFTIGALISGIALAFKSTDVIRWLPLMSFAIGLANAYWITRLPKASHELREPDAERPTATTPTPVHNFGWIGTSFCQGLIMTNQVLLTIVIPLWLVKRTDAPHWVLAWLFGTNTVLCIFLPRFTSKGVRTVRDALRRSRYSTAYFVLSCVVTLFSHSTVGLLTVLLVWLGHVCVTGAELAMGSAGWLFQAKLMDPDRRGEYSGMAEVAGALASFWAPAVFTLLVMREGDVGWLTIAGIVVLGGIAIHPAARLAARFANTHFPERELET